MYIAYFILFLATAIYGAPIREVFGSKLGVRFDNTITKFTTKKVVLINNTTYIEETQHAEPLPTVTLPYGTYRAAEYKQTEDVYIFKNIRFGEPPVGALRFSKPVRPSPIAGEQSGKVGNQCVQTGPPKGMNVVGEYAPTAVGQVVNNVVGGVALYALSTGAEDCLFLDVYVPGEVIRNSGKEKLPVLSWIYGGAVILGAKDQVGIYDGTGLVQESKNKMIFVSSNYRMGALGWLAGTTMNRSATPNVGLWDQRAALEWIQDYIGLFGGDKSKVTAMGESAGASSLFHHLTAFGGKQDPLFSKAILQSPAYEIIFDQSGFMETAFQNFSRLAGCTGSDALACLRQIPQDAKELIDANFNVEKLPAQGAFELGPSVDGTWVRQLAGVEYAQGNYWKGLESIIVSHTSDESLLFSDGHFKTNQDFTDFLNSIFSGRVEPLVPELEALYPPPGPNSPYKDQFERQRAFIRDSSFGCNVRTISNAYTGKTWNLQSSVLKGIHGTDVLNTFLYPGSYLGFLLRVLPAGFPEFAKTYQSYIVSYVVTGDPNTNSIKSGPSAAVNWPRPDLNYGEGFSNVLNANYTFNLVNDMSAPKKACDDLLTLETKWTKQLELGPQM